MPNYPELRGKTAVVTGGSTGIGRAIALRLGREGVQVVVMAHEPLEKVESVARELEALGTAGLALHADLTRPSEVTDAFQTAIQRFGKLDILVNAAGGFPRSIPSLDIDEDAWDMVIDSNVKTTFLCSKAALPGMIERRWGRIVNIGSEVGRMPLRSGAAHYTTSKAAVHGLTRHLAREFARFGVTVNATAPGTTYSDRVRRNLTPEGEAMMVSITPIGRIAEVEDQTGIVVFLCSDEASYITGATIDVSGGKIAI